VKAVSPGQSVVWYDETDRVLGGGVIAESRRVLPLAS
jgi:tRNA U34 2-thiouridine synthase MnmA/TrmU